MLQKTRLNNWVFFFAPTLFNTFLYIRIMIKNIIFDFGGVLIGWNPKHVFRKVFNTEEEVEWFLNNVCTMEWNEQQDGGKLIADAEKELTQKFPEWEKHIKTYYERWHEMLTGPIYKTVDILQNLERSANYNLFGLTNWSAELFPYAKKHYHFLNGFRDIIVSGEVKLKKPDPAIYHLALSRFNVKGEETIFIDDNLRNIESAERQGIHVIHFSSPNQLRSELSSRFGINT